MGDWMLQAVLSPEQQRLALPNRIGALPRWWCLNEKFVSGGGLVTFDRATKCNRLASFCELTS